MSLEPVPGLPPGPPVPSAVQALLAAGAVFTGRFRLEALNRWRDIYGDMFTVHFPGLGKSVLIGDPELVKQTFLGDPKTLHAGENSPLGAVLGRNSLLAIDEEKHLEQRKLVLPPFHGARMHAYEAIVEEEVLREISTWRHGEPLRTLEPMNRITLEVILRAVFGAEGEELEEMRADLRASIPEAINTGGRLIGFPFMQRELGGIGPWARWMRLRRRFEWGVNALVDRARSDPELERRTDVLALFAQATHEDDGSPMTDAEIQDQLITIIAAGHETTATTLAWAVERIRRHPELLRRLVKEAEGDSKELREATIKEVQRTRPVIVGAGREVVKPFELGGYLLPVGTMISISAGLLHTNPRIYPNPMAFDPDRFVGVKPSPYAWVPFGGGIRRCPGAAFASMEMDVVLRTLLRELEWGATAEPDEAWAFRGVAFAPSEGGLGVFGAKAGTTVGSAAHGEEVPDVRDALELVAPAVLELYSRAGDEVAHGS